jgi:squalene-hopene/tetraprenyl-beta-curcumene cyclase
MTGAWSDAAMPPRFTVPVPDMLAPNISATALAGSALAALGVSNSPAGARSFIERCQNFSEGEPTKFDDGGFFFALDDPIRNKAGSAGRDGRGRERFRSYGSATCDGYLALRACGLPPNHPRVLAAAGWLRANCTGMTHGGQWPAGRAEARASLVYYQSQALAAVLADLPQKSGWARHLRASLVLELENRQANDGSWQGLAPDSCEDEPVLATAFATRALALLA